MLEDPRIMRMALDAQLNHRFRLPGAAPFTDDELRSVTPPTVVIVAGNSAPFAPAVQAAKGPLIPNAEVESCGAHHDVSWTHVDDCISHISRAGR